jgi:hypothetical protein
MLHATFTSNVLTKSSKKMTFCVAYVKNTKIGAKISLFMKFFFVFLHSPQKILVFHESVHAHIEYKDKHANIFP